MAETLTESEKAQLEQTIEMFEVIAQSQPSDYQSLEILKEAYSKLGRDKDAIFTAKRIAQAYIQLGQLTSAILEFESILQKYPNDEEARQALANIENQTTANIAAPAEDFAAPEKKMSIKERAEAVAKGLKPGSSDDGKAGMERLLVENKLMSSGDFNMYWVTPEEKPEDVVDPFLQIIADKGLVTLEESIKLLCEKSRLAYIPLEKYDVDVELARQFPKEVCRRWCVLPFDRMSKSVFVATANPFNKQALDDLKKVTQNRIQLYISPPAELVKAIKKVYR